MNKKELAEFLGIVLGDGHLHTKHNRVTVTGSLDDIYYYKTRVIPLIIKLFNIKPALKKNPSKNSYYLYFNSYKVMDLFTKLGMIRGTKKNAQIPSFIKRDKNLILHFLRGLFDTDGYLKFSKQTRTKHYYPRIRLSIRVSKFAKEVGDLITECKLSYGSWYDKRGNGSVYYEISGKENLEKWIKKIDFNNPVHKTKYLFWKNYGYYIPNSSFADRLKSLNLNTDLLTSNLRIAHSPVEE
jgi:DNA-binding transcriptional regulator WhiA